MQAKRIVVAGAGLAGLAAARELERAGALVMLVDARDRAGGRVWTIRDGFADGQHGELGGEFIDAEHTELHRLCDELGLRRLRVLRGGFTHRFRDADGQYRVSRTRPWRELEASLAPLVRTREAGATSTTLREIAKISLRQWLVDRDAGPELHAMANALRGFFLADPDDISVLPVVEQLATGGSPAQAEMFRLEGGNDRLVEALVRSVAGRLRLRHRVTAIRQEAHRVVVSVLDPDGLQQQLEADGVVVTLPASTLADVSISPPLPEAQWRAIRSLRYGCATKVLVQTTRDAFARRRARAFGTDDSSLGAFWDAAEEQTRGPWSMLAFLGGGSVSAGLRGAVERGAAHLLLGLCWLGMAGAHVHAAHTAVWEDDPWARGGYAYVDPGFDPAWRSCLAARAGRLVFAGEHTSLRWQGYMNGAVESGIRAARELIDEE
jgi:monoamine oxidase